MAVRDAGYVILILFLAPLAHIGIVADGCFILPLCFFLFMGCAQANLIVAIVAQNHRLVDVQFRLMQQTKYLIQI